MFSPWVGKIPWIPLQYSCLENPMDRGASQGTVNGVDMTELLMVSLFFFL